MTQNANSRFASETVNVDAPQTGAAAQHASALMTRLYPDQRAALDRGEGASMFVKRIPVQVVDFYEGRP